MLGVMVVNGNGASRAASSSLEGSAVTAEQPIAVSDAAADGHEHGQRGGCCGLGVGICQQSRPYVAQVCTEAAKTLAVVLRKQWRVQPQAFRQD